MGPRRARPVLHRNPARRAPARRCRPDAGPPRKHQAGVLDRPEERDRGIASLAVQAITLWAHHTLDAPRIWLEINPRNQPSLRLTRHAGYHLEQRLPSHCRDWSSEDAEHDSWHDCLIWTHHSEPAPASASSGQTRPAHKKITIFRWSHSGPSFPRNRGDFLKAVSCNFRVLPATRTYVSVRGFGRPYNHRTGGCCCHFARRAAPREGQAGACPLFLPQGPPRSPGSGAARRAVARRAMRQHP